MRLPHSESELLLAVPRAQRYKAVAERRAILRESRDAKGDDRCHITDWLIEDLLIDTPPRLRPANNHDRSRQLMRQCVRFYEHCRTIDAPQQPPDAILDPTRWNEDMLSDSFNGLAELVKIQSAIKRFRDHSIHGQRTTADYRLLYSVLPEKIEADFRLPSIPEFLGMAKPNAGCPAFLDSHASCGSACNLHVWGPCPEPATMPIFAPARAEATPT